MRINTTKLAKSAVLAVAAITVITGCSSSPDRAAAPAEPSLDQGNLGVMVCVQNDSSEQFRMSLRKGDSYDGGDVLEPGKKSCGEGTNWAGDDVWLGPTFYRGQRTFTPLIIGDNPWAGKPTAYVHKGAACTNKSGFDVDETRSWDSGLVKFTIKRLPDNSWKQFLVTVADSGNPLPEGQIPNDCG